MNKTWQDMARNALGPNVELLARRYEHELKPIIALLSEFRADVDQRSLADVFEQYQHRQVQLLEKYHLEWGLSSAVATTVANQQALGVSLQRGPFLVRLSHVFPNDATLLLGDLDAQLRAALDLLKPSIHATIHRLDLCDAIQYAAVLSYRANAWRPCAEYCQRALDLLQQNTTHSTIGVEEPFTGREDVARIELDYLLAVTLRLLMCSGHGPVKNVGSDPMFWRSNFMRAERHLSQSKALSRGRFDVFGLVRAQAELGALYLSAAALDKFHPKLNLFREPKRRRIYIGRALENLLQAFGTTEVQSLNSADDPVGEMADLQKTLYFSICVNLIGATLFFALLERRFDLIPFHALDKAWSHIGQALSKDVEDRPHLAIARKIYSWLREDSAPERKVIGAEVVSECRELARGAQGRAGLTALDLEFLEFYANQIELYGAV